MMSFLLSFHPSAPLKFCSETGTAPKRGSFEVVARVSMIIVNKW